MMKVYNISVYLGNGPSALHAIPESVTLVKSPMKLLLFNGSHIDYMFLSKKKNIDRGTLSVYRILGDVDRIFR